MCTYGEKVVNGFNNLVYNSELIVESSLGKDVLDSILNLYIKVRSFSFAKDIVEKQKISSKRTKAKALRKEVSRSVQAQELEIIVLEAILETNYDMCLCKLVV